MVRGVGLEPTKGEAREIYSLEQLPLCDPRLFNYNKLMVTLYLGETLDKRNT